MRAPRVKSGTTTRINLIAAMSLNRVIGKSGALPWKMGADLKRFRTLTTGCPIIMGRKTYESIGKPLPNRTNIVVTSRESFVTDDILSARSLHEAIQLAGQVPEIWIIGGGSIYEQSMDLADRILLTVVDTDVEGDTYFPQFDDSTWFGSCEGLVEPDDKNEFGAKFFCYERRLVTGELNLDTLTHLNVGANAITQAEFTKLYLSSHPEDTKERAAQFYGWMEGDAIGCITGILPRSLGEKLLAKALTKKTKA